MHLFVVSPALDRLWHLHPAEVATGTFEHRLPDVAGRRLRAVRRCRAQDRPVGDGHRPSRRRRFTARRLRATTAPGPASPSRVDTRAVGRRPHRVGARRTPLVPRRLTMFTFSVEDADGQPATRSRAVHGDAGPRRLRQTRSPSVRARASVGIGADGGDADRRSLRRRPRSSRSTSRAARRGCPPRCRSRTDFRSAGDYRIFVQVKTRRAHRDRRLRRSRRMSGRLLPSRFLTSRERLQAAIPTLNVAVRPLAGSPDTVASSESMLSAKMLSRAFDVGFDPRAAYTPVA